VNRFIAVVFVASLIHGGPAHADDKKRQFHGFYAGLHSGSLTVKAHGQTDTSRLYGGSLGWRHQTDNKWLIGGHLQYDQSSATSFLTSGIVLGYVPHPDFLVFSGFLSLNLIDEAVIDGEKFRSGCCSFTVQAGIEYAVTSHVHLRVDYKIAKALAISNVKNRAVSLGVIFTF